MRRTATICPLVTVLLGTATLLAGPTAAAPPPGACRDPDPARPVVAELPWAQQFLNLDATWPHSTGAGVTVAVVDSGVDGTHPQLVGKVLPGRDFFLVGELPGDFDCGSHGTAVGSIIAATPAAGLGFHGVAPDARVLPVRVSDRELNGSGEPTPIDPVVVATGIRYAVDQGASVINLSLSGYGDYPPVRDAIGYARDRDVVLVAAAGNKQRSGDGPSFPAAYDGVLGVGSIAISGARSDGSQIGPYVDLVAPGEQVVGAARAGGHAYWTGTSFAAPFVAGTAALVRSAWPNLTASQVIQRLLATASPAPGGAGPEYGAGVVDPYRAVTERLSPSGPLAMPAVTDPPFDTAAANETAWWSQQGAAATLGAAAVLLAIAVTVVLAATLPRGARRRWRPTRRPAPLSQPSTMDPPDEVFLFPPPPLERPATPWPENHRVR